MTSADTMQVRSNKTKKTEPAAKKLKRFIEDLYVFCKPAETDEFGVFCAMLTQKVYRNEDAHGSGFSRNKHVLRSIYARRTESVNKIYLRCLICRREHS
jgi:hypothetical protein